MKQNNIRILLVLSLLVVSLYINGCAEQILCSDDNILGGGPLEAGRCADECAAVGSGGYVTSACNHYFPGEQGKCSPGSVCVMGQRPGALSSGGIIYGCGCQMVDRDLDGWVDLGDDVYYAGGMTLNRDWSTFHKNPRLLSFDPSTGKLLPEDCDDTNSMIHPGAAEVCNGVDDDCSDGIEGYDNDPATGIDDGNVCAKTIYLCKEQSPDRDIKYPFHCKDDKEWCSGGIFGGSFDSFVEAKAQCDFEATEANMPGYVEGTELEIYAYYCDELEKKCYAFNKKNFKICSLTEKCHGITSTALNIDSDCDGLEPFTPVKNEDGDITGVDFTTPLDPDCAGEIQEGQCDVPNKKWFKSGEWVTENYCQKCGSQDSTCAKSCEPGRKSCDGGCMEGACDVAADRYCKGGAWTEIGYCATCGLNDSTCFAEVRSTCRPNACDIADNLICYGLAWSASNRDHPYCEIPLCKPKDSDCAGTCTAGACDTKANKFCKASGVWSTLADNYCAECGAVDADCGVNACTDDTCDTTNKKVCKSEVWNGDKIKYCQQCSLQDRMYCTAECGDADTEIDCANGIDDDCDGLVDCLDIIDCPSTMPECVERPCTVPGATQPCGSAIPLCTQGEQTCGFDGRWSECVGGRLPESEVCNGKDDDCDGAEDNNCACTTGQTRSCGVDRGECSSGLTKCKDAVWGRCDYSSGRGPRKEICGDGSDNNCNGETDEGCACEDGKNQTCGQAIGICKPGMQVCSGKNWGECTAVGKMAENTNVGTTCSDGLDNDCDGKADALDEGCSITPAAQLTPSCFDLIKNQDETDMDCGGICAPCVTPANCNNRKVDPGEEGLDCGGECSVPCDENTRVREGPSDTSAVDDTVAEPECGDLVCDDGETDACPEDCAADEGSSLMSYAIPAIVVLGILALGFVAYKKGFLKVGGKKQESAKFPVPKGGEAKPSSAAASRPMPQYTAPKAGVPRKEFKTKEELELEKSLKEEKALLKK